MNTKKVVGVFVSDRPTKSLSDDEFALLTAKKYVGRYFLNIEVLSKIFKDWISYPRTEGQI